MSDERDKAATDSFNEAVGDWVEAYMRAHLLLERARRNEATGPEAKKEVALEAAELMLKVSEMFERLGLDGRDTYAGRMGWASAEELSQFLWEGATSAN